MKILVFILFFFSGIYIYSMISNWISYKILKRKTLQKRKWNLNICCGNTDGGGINVDVVAHGKVNNFVLINNIYDLPFKTNQFENILCSHTLEHVEKPLLFHKELQRICKEGNDITYLLPPIWDISAAFNLFEHKWIFLTIKSRHENQLPKFLRLPLTNYLHNKFGQKIEA